MTYNSGVRCLGGEITFGDEVASKLLGSGSGDRARRTESLQSERLSRGGIVQKQFVDSAQKMLVFIYKERWDCKTSSYYKDKMGTPGFASSSWPFRTRQTGATGVNECSAISFFIDLF